jgi:hypothetical protein
MIALTLAEAQTRVNKEKLNGSYLLIYFGYNSGYILPLKEGIAMLASIGCAEEYSDHYGEGITIRPISPDNDLKAVIVSAQRYKHIKMAKLMGISVDALSEMDKKQQEIEPR